MAEQKKIGIVIASLTVAAALGITGVQVKGCIDSKPKISIDGIGMRGQLAELSATSSAAWPGLRENITAMHNVLRAKYPAADATLRDHLLLDVRGPDDIVSSPLEPTGVVMVHGEAHKANGTIDAGPKEFAFWGPKTYVAIVRRLPGGACRSAFAHEVAEHLVPWIVEGDLNWWHEGTTLPDNVPANDPRRIPPEKRRWIPLDQEITAACIAAAAAH